MSGKRTREQPARKSQSTVQGIAPEAVAKRNKKHLDELERSNYAGQELFTFEIDEKKAGKTRDRQTISDKRDSESSVKRKKSSMNVRTALLYRKNLATLIEESHISRLPEGESTYLTAVAPPPQLPPRMLCSVCGYHGRYKCKRCALPYCDRNCEGVHADTRCERRVV